MSGCLFFNHAEDNNRKCSIFLGGAELGSYLSFLFPREEKRPPRVMCLYEGGRRGIGIPLPSSPSGGERNRGEARRKEYEKREGGWTGRREVEKHHFSSSSHKNK